MTEISSRDRNPEGERHPFGWLMLPLAFFPLAALLTYDWHAVEALNIPPTPSANWIGAVGDTFAFRGYQAFGLAIWLVPFFCILAGFLTATGHRLRTGWRKLWLLVFMAAVACIVEILTADLPGMARLLAKINLEGPGGFIGYLAMKRFLSPSFGNFGATIAMSVVAAASLIAAIGLKNLLEGVIGLWKWSISGLVHEPRPPRAGDAADEARYIAEQAEYQAELQAKADEKAAKRAEKERLRAEKLAEKERLRAEKEAEKAAKLAEREAAEEERRLQMEETARREREQHQPELFPELEPAQTPIARQPSVPKTSAVRKPAPKPAPEAEPPVEDKGPYILPGLDLLAPLKTSVADHSDVGMMSEKLVNTLKLFNVNATVSYTVEGPVVTKYALALEPGTRYSAVTNISDNLMGALHAKSLRIEAPIPGEECVGIEVPNTKPAGISFREVFESEAWKTAMRKSELPLLFGKRADGKELVADLASMPHMLVAGATGQGKSVCLNSLICGLLMTKTPEQLKLIMVDPKSVEFASYSQIPHLLIPVIADNNKVVKALMWAVVEMEKRLKLFTRARVRNIFDFNHRKQFTQTDMFGADTEVGSGMPKTIPYIVIIIDEVADLMSQCAKEVTGPISRIAAKARAAGIHLVLATQRPDAKVITGTIKANIPGRVAFKTASAIDSRTILDDSGAENLIGRGDMLFKGKDGILTRAQGAWISDDEIANVTQFIEQHSNLQFDEKFAKNLARVQEAGVVDPFADLSEEDAKAAKSEQREQVKAAENASDFKKAIECVINTKRASTSHFQRQMGWGYNHAAKILDMLSERGIVSPPEGMGPRRIIMDEDAMVAILNEGETDQASAAADEETARSGEIPGDIPDDLFGTAPADEHTPTTA